MATPVIPLQDKPQSALAAEGSNSAQREASETRLLQWQCGWWWSDGVELSVVLVDLDANDALKKAQEALPRARKEDLASAALHAPEHAARIGRAALGSVGCVELPAPEKAEGAAAIKAARKRNDGIFQTLRDFCHHLPRGWRDWDTKAPGEAHARRIAVSPEGSILDFDDKTSAQKMCAAATAEMRAIVEESFGPDAILLSLAISTDHGEPGGVDVAIAAAIERWTISLAMNEPASSQKTPAGVAGDALRLSQKAATMRL